MREGGREGGKKGEKMSVFLVYFGGVKKVSKRE
jgi:hypothetical protein